MRQLRVDLLNDVHSRLKLEARKHGATIKDVVTGLILSWLQDCAIKQEKTAK